MTGITRITEMTGTTGMTRFAGRGQDNSDDLRLTVTTQMAGMFGRTEITGMTRELGLLG